MVNSSRIKVGLFGTFPPEQGGVAMISKNLSDHLRKICKVVTIGLNNSDADYKISVTENFVSNLKQIIEKEKLDILHMQYITSGRFFGYKGGNIILAPLKTLLANIRFLTFLDLDIPKVVTLSEVHTTVRNIKDRLSKLFERLLAERAGKIIVYEENLKKSIFDNWKVKAEYIPHGIKQIKISKRAGKVIMFQGIINREKGLDYLIESMKFLPDYLLIIRGEIVDKYYGNYLEEKIKENNLSNVKLEFGWVANKEKDKLYRRAGIIVVPYTWAPYPSGILHEAISYRTPVVVTDIPSLSRIVKKFGCGAVVKVKNSEDLADGIRKVTKNYKACVRGVEKYRKFANWDVVAKMHLKMYNETINKYRTAS